MRVDLYFRLPGVRNLSLQVPAEWQGQRELYKAIRAVEAVSDQTVLKPTADPSRRQLTFALGQIVPIRYRVAQDWEGAISADTYFRAILQHSFFQLTGEADLAVSTQRTDRHRAQRDSSWRPRSTHFPHRPRQHRRERFGLLPQRPRYPHFPISMGSAGGGRARELQPHGRSMALYHNPLTNQW